MNDTRRGRKQTPRIFIGWREWVGLPDLGVEKIKVKIDTGARTSAIHAWNIRPFDQDGVQWVEFDLHPIQRDNRTILPCRAPVKDVRAIRSSNGKMETRYIVRTLLQLGDRNWPIDLSLTNRDAMGFRMLLGRTALRHKKLRIDPGRSFLIPRPAHLKT